MTGKYRANIVIRLILLIIVSVLTGWSFGSGQPAYTGLTLASVLVIQVVNLFYYINRVNRKIAFFFEAVKNEDHSLSFPSHRGDSVLEKLSANMERINRQIQKIHIENRLQEQYFSALTEKVATGIFSFDQNGFVINANSSAREMLGLKQFTHLKQLEKLDEKLAASIKNMKEGDERLVSCAVNNETVTFFVKASGFKGYNGNLTLVSMQNIRKELDEKELDSWLKLIRVLTHEIMNTIAPVTSLSENLCSYFVKDGEAIPAGEVNDKMISMTIKGLEVIREQGQGLTRFVESYRKLTRLPAPEKKSLKVKELVEKTVLLLRPEQAGNKVRITFSVADDITIYADEKLVSQTLVNLVKNSVEALQETGGGMISIWSRRNRSGGVEISVADNGPGIPAELIDEIFIPFFTTRENGTGIGLSLSRRIMKMHKGDLKVKSIPGKETVFTMVF